MTQAQTGSLARPFVYNANGDVTSLVGLGGVTNTLTYDPFGRLSSHTRSGVTTTYTVNALDQRMAKANAGGSSRYVYVGFNQLLAEYTNGQWTSYIWNGNAPVAMVRNNQIYYIHTDHLGRPQLATDASRTLVWKASNYAFNRSVSIDSIGGLNLGYPGQYYCRKPRRRGSGVASGDARAERLPVGRDHDLHGERAGPADGQGQCRLRQVFE